MKKKTIWGGIMALFILQACENKTPEPTGNDSFVKNEVTFTSDIDDAAASRAYGASWEKGDRIGVYMLANGGDNILESNVPYATRAGDGNFVGDGGVIRFPENEGQSVDFVAYYPYSAGMTGLAYSVDVTDQSKQEDIDLMVSNNLTGRTPESLHTGNNLQFSHVLSQLSVNLKSADNGSLEGLKITVLGTKTRASLNLKDKSLSDPEGTTDIAAYINKEYTQAEAILVPQTLDAPLRLRLEINGKSKEVDTEITALATGMKYICNLSISNAGGSVTIDPEAKYVKWTETPVITESQLAQSNLKYITHYTDQNYSNASWGKVRNYSMLYDTNLKMAYWVAYPLNSWFMTNADGHSPDDNGRTNDWDYDPNLSEAEQPTLFKAGTGFTSQDYSRGHQIPSADRLRTYETNAQTFYFTNMTPQLYTGFNGTVWGNLEGAVRGWCSGTDTLYVVTGAMPTEGGSEIEYASDNDWKRVAVPKYYFKALARKVQGTFQTLAFKLDHRAYTSTNDWRKCSLSVNELEEITGFTFFPQIDERLKDNASVW